MELGAFVALWLASTVSRLTSAELTKVLGSLGDNILEQLHLDPAKLLA